MSPGPEAESEPALGDVMHLVHELRVYELIGTGHLRPRSDIVREGCVLANVIS